MFKQTFTKHTEKLLELREKLCTLRQKTYAQTIAQITHIKITQKIHSNNTQVTQKLKKKTFLEVQFLFLAKFKIV